MERIVSPSLLKSKSLQEKGVGWYNHAKVTRCGLVKLGTPIND